MRFDAILVVPPPLLPPVPVDDAVRVDCFGVFLGFFGILDNFYALNAGFGLQEIPLKENQKQRLSVGNALC